MTDSNIESQGSTTGAKGWVAPGFEAVRDAFEHNLRSRGEVGAACAAFHRGRPLVDLWGGVRDAASGAPWQRDTLVLVFSTTKGIAGMAMALAHSRGWLELDERVASYWPEFAQRGKQRITVRQLLSHRAGLSAPDERIDAARMADLDAMAELMARQAPAWEPGTRHGYHGLSLGWYENELLRRVDPAGRSLGVFVSEEIAKPLDVELYVGLPAEVSDRVATLAGFHPLQMLAHPRSMPPRMLAALLWPWSITSRSLLCVRVNRPTDFDLPAYRAVEFPSANGITNARSLACAYGGLAMGGASLGLGATTFEELTAAPERPPEGWRDAVLKLDAAYAFGFSKPSAGMPFGTSERAFGAPGSGGSFAFADPDAELGFAYVMNRMGFHLFDDPREKALREACHECIAAKRG